MALEERSVSNRGRNLGRSYGRRDSLCGRVSDRAQGTCERERGHEQASDSRSICLRDKTVLHFFVLQFLCVIAIALKR
jgi:hypothetical protein